MSERIAPTRTPEFEARLKKRYASERRFRALGLGAIVFSVAVLVFLLGTMTFNGIGGFQRVEMEVPIDFTEAGIAADPAAMEQPGALASLEAQGLRDVVQYFAEEELGEAAAEELGAQAWRDVATAIIADPAVLQRSESFWLPASANLASGYEGEGSPEMQALAAGLYEEGRLAKNFDPGFLGRSDATNPQQVGIWGALKGSLLTMVVTLLLAFPIGVLAALYLEEYAPKNRWTDLIELSINNLAAVPSIIFGLLGLAVFLTLFPNLRSAPLIGGMTLALMTMPVIVIAGRNAAEHPRRRARNRCLARAGGLPPRPPARPARHPDRHHHRHGPSARRNRAAADDRHARLRGHAARRLYIARNRAADADFPVVGRNRPRLRGTHQRGDHRAIAVPARDERARHLPA